MSLPGSPAVLVLHWWNPLEFEGSFWEVAQDELDVIASYYDIQVGPCAYFPFPSCVTFQTAQVSTPHPLEEAVGA